MTFQEMREDIWPDGGIEILGPARRVVRFFQALEAINSVLEKLSATYQIFSEEELAALKGAQAYSREEMMVMKGGDGNGQQEEDQAPEEA